MESVFDPKKRAKQNTFHTKEIERAFLKQTWVNQKVELDQNRAQEIPMDKKKRVRTSPPHNTPTKEKEEKKHRKIQLVLEKSRRREIE